MIGLTAVAAAFGLIAAYLFRSLVNSREVSRVTSRMLAHVMGFALYADEPALIFSSQRELLYENFRLLRLIATPLLVSAVFFAGLWWPLDRNFGRTPARVGTIAIISSPIGQTLSSDAVVAEIPPVHVPRLNQQLWRVRVVRESQLVAVPAQYLSLPWSAWFGIVSTLAGLGWSATWFGRASSSKI